jgi:hypothetical protein
MHTRTHMPSRTHMPTRTPTPALARPRTHAHAHARTRTHARARAHTHTHTHTHTRRSVACAGKLMLHSHNAKRRRVSAQAARVRVSRATRSSYANATSGCGARRVNGWNTKSIPKGPEASLYIIATQMSRATVNSGEAAGSHATHKRATCSVQCTRGSRCVQGRGYALHTRRPISWMAIRYAMLHVVVLYAMSDGCCALHAPAFESRTHASPKLSRAACADGNVAVSVSLCEHEAVCGVSVAPRLARPVLLPYPCSAPYACR